MSYDDTYLSHHGIKGQKWGVRRFQNEDGSYTNMGKEHRGERISIGSAKRAYKQAVKENNMRLGREFDKAGDNQKAVTKASMRYDKQRQINKANYHADRARAYNEKANRALTNVGRDKYANKASRELLKSDIHRATAKSDIRAINDGKKALKRLNMQTAFMGDRGSGAYNRYREAGNSAVKAYFRNFAVGSFS